MDYPFVLLPTDSCLNSGCNKLQRKLLFADSLAKLPYKIGGIREVLSNMLNLFSELQFKNERYTILNEGI